MAYTPEIMLSRFLPALLAVTSCLCPVAVCVSAPEPLRIEIKSSWQGQGEPDARDLTITGKNNRYTTNGRRVDARAVQALIEALHEPVVDEPSLAQCGITQQWLLANYRQGLEDYTHEKIKNLSLKQVELFKEQFTVLAHAETAFSELFKTWHTDDYPEMSVTVFTAGRQFEIQSNSQKPFMLPWVGKDAHGGGYNCRISQAIAALLPSKFVNRERLTPNRYFRWNLTEQVMEKIKQRWNLLDTEFKIGRVVAPVFARYAPLKSEISYLSSIDVDGSLAWNAELRSKELPENMTLGISLRYYKKKLSGVNQLLTRLPRYSNLALSVPWLASYLKAHPNASSELRYVNGRSLSVHAETSLTDDLRQHGKDGLAQTVSDQAADSAFLEINSGPGCWSRILVLPSKQVLIWHFKCDEVLGFPARELGTWDYLGWRSTGSLVQEDGTLIK
jgi:hypothetical protein